MYVAPQLTDLGSFQELTLATDAGILGPVGSLVNTVGGVVGGAVSGVSNIVGGVLYSIPGISVDDNSHIGVSDGQQTVIAPKITITPR